MKKKFFINKINKKLKRIKELNYEPWCVLVAGFQLSGRIMGKQTLPFSSILGW